MSANHEKTRKPELPAAVIAGGKKRQPEPSGASTPRGKTFKARQEAMGRSKWEVWITDEEREELKVRLRRLRT